MGSQVPADTGQSDREFIDEALSTIDEGTQEETGTEEAPDEEAGGEVEIDLDEPAADEETEEVVPDEEEVSGEEDSEDEETKEAAPLPEYKDIKAKYPKFFEDFPELKEAFFLGKRLTSLFPSYELAQDAKDQLRSFEAIRISSLEEGDPTHLFSALSEADPAGFKRMVGNILPNLFQHAPQLYLEVTTPVLENLVRTLYKEGETNDNKNLKAAAQIFSKYLWGSFDIPQAKPKVADPEVKRLSNERQQDLIRRENEFKEEVRDLGVSNLKQRILTGLDPENVIPGLVKEALVDRVLRETGRALDKDGLHNNRMNALWELAAKHGFAREYRKKLVETYIRAAGAKMPAIRAKLRAQVTGKQETKVPVIKKEIVKRPPPGKNNTTGGKVPLSKIDPKKIDWSKTTDRDILAGKVTYKR